MSKTMLLNLRFVTFERFLTDALYIRIGLEPTPSYPKHLKPSHPYYISLVGVMLNVKNGSTYHSYTRAAVCVLVGGYVCVCACV